MSTAEEIKAQFQVSITPVIKDVDVKQEEPSVLIPFNIRSGGSDTVEPKPKIVRTHLRVNWATVVAHPRFQPELREYIRKDMPDWNYLPPESVLGNELGGEILIEGNDVSYTDDSLRSRNNPVDEALFRNKLNNFMHKLRFETLNDLKAPQMKILRDHESDVAFVRLNARETMIAAKPSELARLKQKLLPKLMSTPVTEQPFTRTTFPYTEQ